MIYKTEVGRFSYAELLTKDVDIADVEFLRALEIEFNGTLTAAGGSGDATLKEDGLLNTILKSLLLTAGGSDPFYSTKGRNEYWRRAVKTGSPGVHGSVIPTGAASTAQRVHVVMDMCEIATAMRFAGKINARPLSSLQLRVETGQVEVDMVTGGDRTESMTGTFNVYAVWDDGGRKAAGAEDAYRFRGGGRRVSQQRLAVAAANELAELVLPSGQLIPSIMFLVVDNSVRNSALLTDITAKVGQNDVIRKVTFKELQSQNVERYGLTLASGLPPYAGIGILDFDLDGDMHPAKLLSTVGLKANSAKMILNVGAPTGTAYVDMIVNGIDPSGVGK